MAHRTYKGVDIFWDKDGSIKYGYADRGLAHWYIVLIERLGKKERGRTLYFHTLSEVKRYITTF